jgi:hypothetical protein
VSISKAQTCSDTLMQKWCEEAQNSFKSNEFNPSRDRFFSLPNNSLTKIDTLAKYQLLFDYNTYLSFRADFDSKTRGFTYSDTSHFFSTKPKCKCDSLLIVDGRDLYQDFKLRHFYFANGYLKMSFHIEIPHNNLDIWLEEYSTYFKKIN